MFNNLRVHEFVVQLEAMGRGAMGTRLLVQDGTYPVLWRLGGAPALDRRAWQSLGSEAGPGAANDNGPDCCAKAENAPALGGGVE